MKVSVIIPCFNLGQYLDDAISSVESQTYSDWEIIIVDDGSTERETTDAIKIIEAQKKHRIIRQKNSGPAAARNKGIKEAKGEYIVCLDADDILTPTYFEKALNLIVGEDEKTAFITTWLQEFGLRNNIWKTSDYNVSELLITNIVHAGSLFKKLAWEEVGGFEEDRKLQGYEDWEFWLSLIEAGYKWAVVKEPLFLYRIRHNSLLSTAKNNHPEKYSLIYDLHKDLFKKHSKDLVFENTREIEELHKVIAEKNKAIEELEKYKDEVVSLRQQIFSVKDELHNLQNSRIISKVLKVREVVGAARQHTGPKKTLHSIRVLGAPFVPGSVRRTIKTQLKKVIVRESNLEAGEAYVENPKREPGKPLVSVIVPYYNRADTIDDTIESLKGQSFKNFEVILVDDGSTEEDSQTKLKNLDYGHMNLKIVRQKNAGVAAARNNGISQSKGKYIICLDSDDMLDLFFIEKCTLKLEAYQGIDLITTHRQDFGVINDIWVNNEFDALDLPNNNMVITAAEYRKKAWEKSGGYKSNIGYEDWEYWINLAENGFWGKLLPETLFKYRTALQSRFVDDKDVHWRTLDTMRTLHPRYNSIVKALAKKKNQELRLATPSTALVNMNEKKYYNQTNGGKKNILIALPWMTFGGAETLIINFCQEVKDDYILSFVTGLKSEHEWEYKFKELSQRVYHLANIFQKPEYYIEFMSNYIETRDIDELHIIHTSEFFEMLPELKRRHPKLKVITTIFNDRAEHFRKSVEFQQYIDVFTTDNNSVRTHYSEELPVQKNIQVIANGINCYEIFNPALLDREGQRQGLNIEKNDMAVFFIGRLSEEKNPDVFCDVADEVLNTQKIRGIKFFLIGDGPMRLNIEKRLKQINNKNLAYIGYQSKIAEYLSAADVFVLPSSIEGFPLSILEAMAMRVAVIASNVGAVSEVINSGKNGFVVSPGSVNEIKNALLELKSDVNKLNKIKINGRKKVETTYSNTILGINYKKLYRSSK